MRQDMLEETLQETFDGEGAGFELSGVGRAILESDLGSLETAAMLNGDQAAIADGDAMNIGSQIFESSLTIANGFAMDDPILVPNLCGDLIKERGVLQSASKGSTEQLGKGLHRQEEVIAGRKPELPIWAQPASRSQVVEVGMIEQIARPGMQDTHQANLTADIAWVLGQRLGCLSRSLKQDGIHQLLVALCQVAQLRREGESQHEIGHRQKQFALRY